MIPEWLEAAADPMSDPLNKMLRDEDEDYEPDDRQLVRQSQILVRDLIENSGESLRFRVTKEIKK